MPSHKTLLEDALMPSEYRKTSNFLLVVQSVFKSSFPLRVPFMRTFVRVCCSHIITHIRQECNNQFLETEIFVSVRFQAIPSEFLNRLLSILYGRVVIPVGHADGFVIRDVTGCCGSADALRFRDDRMSENMDACLQRKRTLLRCEGFPERYPIKGSSLLAHK